MSDSDTPPAPGPRRAIPPEGTPGAPRSARRDLLRRLPGVDGLLENDDLRPALERHGRRVVVGEIRRALEALRESLRGGASVGGAPGRGASRDAGGLDASQVDARVAALPAEVAARLDRRAEGGLSRVINATGVLVHTNLGRAPLGRPAVERLAQRAGSALDLELDLETGRRGRRAPACEELLVELTGAQAACVVNNCAAALLLALNTLARGRPVVVSRGELVEIGGSFRIPDICERSGVRLLEVGTTNRTRLSDYEAALEAEDSRSGGIEAPGLILKVHPSNFRVVGFTQSTSVEELVALGRKRGVPVVMDQGSGALSDLSSQGVRGEDPVPELVAAGADLVLFSGDKLLGGPQAGCIVGRRDAVSACRRSPLYRALRPDRLTLLALEATLWSHATGRVDEIPVLARLARRPEELRRGAEASCDRVSGSLAAAGITASVVEGVSTSGGGSSPDSELPTWLVELRCERASPDAVAKALRGGTPPVLARIADDAVLLDLRTVSEDEVPELEAALRAVSRELGG